MKIEIEIAPRRIADLMVTAIEGGSNYWCRSVLLLRWEPGNHFSEVLSGREAVAAAEADSESDNWYDCPALFGDGSLFEIEVGEYNEEGEPQSRRITQADFKVGLKLMAEKYGQHFGDFLNDNEDATTADVFLQCVALKDIVYG
jgi:hypothetical protein